MPVDAKLDEDHPSHSLLTTIRGLFGTGSQESFRLLALLVLLYVAIVALRSPDFLSLASLFDLVRSGAAWTIVALGVLVVMVTGGIDVSFLANAILSAWVATALSNALGIDSLAFALVVSIGLGACVGLVNGLIIYLFSLPTLITTLAMQGVLQGILMVFLGARPITAGFMPASLRAFGTDVLFEVPLGAGYIGLSVFVIPLVIVIALTWYILNRTSIGRAGYALGSNPIGAVRSGVRVLNVNVIVYGYAGALAGLMGLMMVSDIRLVNPVSLVGSELLVLAAVVIGGAKLTGGTGSVAGVVLGMTLITLLNNTLVTLGLSASWNRFFIGLAMVTIASISHYRARKRNERLLNFESI
ncbi:ABC transporter permease [Hoeflea sp.]|uniref:ABC transporter permease n=1 Tax=Hoeflea sp. TaxID=1940281 RepID=UPI0019B77CD7|nr:ABC transporter permease [Hoeflea sp.]MBC7285170.1 ABC transporter permease [Hoeflea sp.]